MEDLTLVPGTEVARIARDRLRERETALLQLRVNKAAGDAVDDAEVEKVEGQIDNLKAIVDEAEARGAD